MPSAVIPEEHRADIETLWDYLQMHHELRPTDVGIGLGSHDPTVPEVAVQLFGRGMFPQIVFTGANSPTTIDRYPRGEAVQYGEYAVAQGVPEHLVLLEPNARNTVENVLLTRALLAERSNHPRSGIIVTRPYSERRAHAVFRRHWPELEVSCASTTLSSQEYVDRIGDEDLVVNMMVGDLYRLSLDLVENESIPEEALHAFDRLRLAGFKKRLPPAPNLMQ